MANEKRLIDANEVIRETESIINFRKQHHMPTIEYEALLGYLKNRPTVDAVEVVRCKDCIFAEPCDASDSYVECRQFFGMAMENDWYCAGGERKDDGRKTD